MHRSKHAVADGWLPKLAEWKKAEGLFDVTEMK
jgi:hypothetical protein